MINLTSYTFLTVTVSGSNLDEAYLSNQGFVLTAPYTYISMTDISTQRFVYTFTYDGVHKYMTRMVM